MLAIAANSFDVPSETFIRAHVKHIAPGRTVLLCRKAGGTEELGCPVLSGVRARWRPYFDPALRWVDETRVRAFLKRHEVRAVLAEYGPNGSLLRLACERAGVPLFAHFHGYDATKLPREASVRRQYSALFRDAAGIIVPSKFLAERLIALGCPDKKLHVSPNGIDHTMFRSGTRDSLRIVAVSRLVPVKGPLQTIEAFARVRQRVSGASLDIIGDGELFKDCTTLAYRLGVSDAITFHGAKSEAFVADLMARAGLFVQHSITATDGQTESFGIAPLEAAASEVPVVATRSGGIPETVTDGEMGLLVAERDVEGMAEAMIAILEDQPRAKAMGRAGRARVEALFTHDRTAARLREIMGLKFCGDSGTRA